MNLRLTQSRAEWLHAQLVELRNAATTESTRLHKLKRAPLAAGLMLREAGLCADIIDALTMALANSRKD
jgi:hypothetical protein